VTNAEWAYLAGLIDGEGCLYAYVVNPSGERGQTFEAGLRVGMTDESVLAWAQANTGAGRLRKQQRKERWKPLHVWDLNLTDTARILPELLPYLQVKRRHAELILQFAGNKKDRETRFEIVKEIRVLNKRGEP
jgi:hypothetical protein